MKNYRKDLLARASTGTDTQYGYLVNGKGATITVRTTWTATGTVKIYGTLRDDATVDFSAAASYANPHTPLNLVDNDSGSTIAGATGVAVAGTDIVKTYDINVNSSCMYIAPVITAWTQGTFAVDISLTDIDARS